MAINLMKMDNRLNKLRFKLVPSKIKEINFWSNYFYRVSLIIESQTRLNNDNNNDDTTKLNNDNMNNSDDRNALMSARAYEDALDAALEDDGNLNLLDEQVLCYLWLTPFLQHLIILLPLQTLNNIKLIIN